jgi:hypothetical protein
MSAGTLLVKSVDGLVDWPTSQFGSPGFTPPAAEDDSSGNQGEPGSVWPLGVTTSGPIAQEPPAELVDVGMKPDASTL